MSQRPSPLRFTATVLAAVATGTALMGVVSTFLLGGAGTSVGFRTFPLFALVAFGVVGGTLTLLALSARADTSISVRVKTCASCGSAVLENWRLCPDCGRFIEPGDGSSGPNHADTPAAVRDSVLPN